MHFPCFDAFRFIGMTMVLLLHASFATRPWVQENLPAGWGDTYTQTVAGQAFDITNLKNGTYYIEIIANPEHVLHETDTSNDVSLRKVILSGTKGHRHVKVLPFYGMDPEG